MTQDELSNLLHNLSTEEKIGQLLQLDAGFFRNDVSFETGPDTQYGFTKEDSALCGSVLNISGANNIKQIQEAYIEQHPHRIPLLFMLDVINGYRTVFPIPLAQGCTFSPDLVELTANISACEASLAGIHVDFSPMSDLVTDCRWGRVMESTGEDPYLNSLLTEAAVRGYQGKNIKDQYKLASCLKHFAGYGSAIAGRDYNTVELSERTFFEDHLPSYIAAIQAGCKLVMPSFNTLNRIPATANEYLLQDILRKHLDFDGVVISDYNAVGELLNHGIAKDQEEAAKLALKASVDVDMCSSCYVHNIMHLIDTNQISMELIDEAVLRVLTLKNDLGLFENPYKDADELEFQKLTLSPKHRKAAFDVAVNSFVLLKNEDSTLPLRTTDQVAYIGSYYDSKSLHGVWSHQAVESDTITISQGLTNLNVPFLHTKGCPILSNEDEVYGFDGLYISDMTLEEQEQELQKSLELARQVSTVVLCLGEHRVQSGEGGSRAKPTLPSHQVEFIKQVHQVNPNIVLVLFTGRPLVLTEIEPYCKSILCVWFPGTEGGNAIASVLYGQSNPSGRLSMCFPREIGQLPMSYRSLRTGRPYNPEVHKTRFVSRYQDCPNTPLYPFGYGLSYTSFTCSPITLSQQIMKFDDILLASVTVTNTGNIVDKQVLQLYVSDPYASVCRPERELKSIQTVKLNPHESRTVTFEITESMFRFYDRDMNYVSESGDMIVYIGFDSSTTNCANFNYAKESSNQ